MRRSLVPSTLLLAFALAAGACGGSHNDAKSADSAQKDLSSMDQLKAIPTDLSASVSDLMKPLDDTQNVIDEVTSMPSRLGISASDMMAMAKATIDNGDVSVKVNGDVSDDARAQIAASLKKLKGVVQGLKAAPEKVAALTKKLVEVTAKLPVLATKVSAESQVAIANPFGSADSKAKAKADLESVKQVQADVQKQVSDAQAKVTGIPALATGALAKLTASFATGGNAKSSAQ